MNGFRNVKKNRFLFRFFISYLVVLVFAFLIGMIVYQKTLAVVKSDERNATKNVLNETKKIMDMRMHEIELTAWQIQHNQGVIRFEPFKDPFQGDNTYKLIDTQKRLFNYSLSNQFIFNYFVVFKNSNVALNDKMVSELPGFYQNIYHPDHMSYQQWYKRVLDQYHQRTYIPASNYTFKGDRYSLISYIHSLGLPQYHDGAILILIDNAKVKKMLQSIHLSDGGWAYITDQNGKVISWISKNSKKLPGIIPLKNANGVIQKKIHSQMMMVTYTTSRSNGWVYVAVQPIQNVMKKVDFINRITFYILLAGLLFGLLMAYLMAFRNVKPIKKLTSKQDELQRKLEDQLPFLRSAFFARLINGGFNTQEEIETLMPHVGIQIGAGPYAAGILYLNDTKNGMNGAMLDELDVKRVVAKEVLFKYLGDRVHIYDIEENKIALFLSCCSQEEENCKNQLTDFIRQIHVELQDAHCIQSVFVLGGFRDKLIGFSYSYEEARQVLYYLREDFQNDVIWYEDLPKDENSFYFPANVESRLIHFAKAGDEKSAVELLDHLYEENFEKRKLPIRMLRLFLYEMWGSIVKILDQVMIDDVKSFDLIQTLPDERATLQEIRLNYNEIIRLFKIVCKTVDQQKKSRNTELIEDILNDLEAHYSSSDLSLTLISERFGMSEGYLSRFFKEQTGMKFSEYVEKLRMEKAKELLVETKLPVREIANNIGYSSVNTFGRAFRRMCGVSPTNYRNSMNL